MLLYFTGTTWSGTFRKLGLVLYTLFGPLTWAFYNTYGKKNGFVACWIQVRILKNPNQSYPHNSFSSPIKESSLLQLKEEKFWNLLVALFFQCVHRLSSFSYYTPSLLSWDYYKVYIFYWFYWFLLSFCGSLSYDIYVMAYMVREWILYSATNFIQISCMSTYYTKVYCHYWARLWLNIFIIFLCSLKQSSCRLQIFVITGALEHIPLVLMECWHGSLIIRLR